MKLSKKILWSILGISLLGVVLTSGVNLLGLKKAENSLVKTQKDQINSLYHKNVKIMTEANRQNVLTFAENYKDTIETECGSIIDNLKYLSHSLEGMYAGTGGSSQYDDSMWYLQPGVSFGEVEEEFQKVKSIRDRINDIAREHETFAFYYVTESGVLLSNVQADYSAGSGIDRRTRDWYVGAKKAGDVFWTDVYQDALSQKMAITCSVPVYDEGGVFRGVVAADIPLEEMCGSILSTKAENIAYTFVMNQNGEFVIGSREDETIRDVVGESDSKSLTEKMTASGMDGGAGACLTDDMVAGYAPVKNAGWYVGIVMDYDKIIAPAKDTGDAILKSSDVLVGSIQKRILQALVMSLVIVGIIVLLVWLVSAKLSRSIADPIVRLTGQVERIGTGALDQKIDSIQSEDEIGVLSRTFNKMTEELKEYIENLASVTADKERIATELNVATQIQASMLPCIFPAFPERTEFDIFATMEPAKEVGGDFYDFFLVDETHLGVVIADVSGKGVPAALFMVIAKTLIKNHAQAGESPAEVFTNVNRQLCETNEAGLFVTAWMGIYDMESGDLTYVNAGHNPPLLKQGDGEFVWLKSRAGFVLAGMEGIKYRQAVLNLAPGDMLYLYTDGVTEATDTENELYGEERLLRKLNQMAKRPLQEILPGIKESIDVFVKGAPQFDDITMLVLRIQKREV